MSCAKEILAPGLGGAAWGWAAIRTDPIARTARRIETPPASKENWLLMRPSSGSRPMVLLMFARKPVLLPARRKAGKRDNPDQLKL